ncbi:MAG: flagellar biosynthesis protein FlhA [Alphaproteobacteria bacterium]|nr:flagellar biosynthesis protein FlhA [Alphaproteobacteria bacterium]
MERLFAALNPSILVRRGDIIFTFALIAVLVILILPMPTWLLDIALALSITLSIIILVTALFIEQPLEFNSFPMVLLVATIFRLSLNVASTRLILSNGHEGPAAAGHIIYAFGRFIMGGNFVIGLIIFSILLIINFMVITKGSGRIAEVSARFSLDALPGKQMAIDADLAAGALTDQQAKARRKVVEDESNFYGAMDGAAKFVRGDAVAGLLITFINIIGGILIGVLQQGISLSDAAASYTFLTVGDGLVSQIPGLIVSVAAGMIVSKGSTQGSADKALFQQLSAHPTALGICSFLLFVFALIPGIPFFPFAIIASAVSGLAWFSYEKIQAQKDTATATSKKADSATSTASQLPGKESITGIDMVRIELSYNLLPLLNRNDGVKITDQIKNIREQLGIELGFVLPAVRMQDNMDLEDNHYSIKIKEIEAGSGKVCPDKYLAMSPNGEDIPFPGEVTTEPAFGLPAKWIAGSQKETAEHKGFTVVDPATVITTHMIELVKENISELITFADVQKLIDGLNESHRKLVNDMVPSQVSMGTIQRILQNLLDEKISIRDLPTILEAVSESGLGAKSITALTEFVRSRLGRQITHSFAQNNVLNVVMLSSEWESEFASSIVGDYNSARELAMAPSQLQKFIKKSNDLLNRSDVAIHHPVIVTSSNIRPFVQTVIDKLGPRTPVLSQNEIHHKVSIETLGEI